MLFRQLVETYERLEATSGRLEMTDLLAQLLRGAGCDEIGRIVYLTQGQLYPDFYPQKLGLADRLLLRALAFTTGLKESDVRELWLEEGDPGEVAEQVLGRKRQTSLFSEPLTLDRVYRTLERIARSEGEGSQELKIKLLAEILHDASPTEAKYIARMVTGRMRLGLASMTVVDALSHAFLDRRRREEVERAFNISSDLGMVGEVLCREGEEGLKGIRVRVGNPIRPMLAERLSSAEEILERMGERCAFEYKYDGVRVQAHLSGGIRLYSRRLEEITSQFPDVVQALSSGFRGGSAIIEGECVPVDINTGEMLPFQEVSHRRGRKHGLKEAVEEYPVRLFLFDLLYLDGSDMTSLPFPERRRALEGVIEEGETLRLSHLRVLDSPEQVNDFFQQALRDGCEGLMAKSINDSSIYRAGARGMLWIKYKKEYRSEMVDTVDLVVVGAYAGRGRRGGKYGALLMATYDDERDRWESICKLGSGFDDETLAALPSLLEGYRLGYKHERVDTGVEADFWFEPAVVLEVLGSEITLSPIHVSARSRIREGSGLAIRFPRFTGKIRDDKGPREATTSAEMGRMYRRQMKRVEG